MEIRQILERHGFTFKKKFGQNFLTDTNLLEAIVADAGIGKTDTVLEIGAGAGALTRALAGAAGRVVAVEIDTTLRPVLEETLGGLSNVELLFCDIQKCDLAALEEKLGRYSVVANLPYYVTTPVVMKFIEDGKTCTGLTVMVQEEVAERFCAQAGTREYGAVTAAIALRASCTITRRVSRNMFVPRPNVDSAVVHMRFEDSRLGTVRPEAYRAVVRAAFSARRKTLENNLAGAFRLPRDEVKARLNDAGISPLVRGETLSPQEFARLAASFPNPLP